MLVLVLQRLAVEFVLDIFYFPVWWYTSGLKRVGKATYNLFLAANSTLLPILWLKNLFVPMYGQNDWQGRFVSVIIRFLNVIIRFFLLFLWVLICIFLLILWILVPIAILYMAYISFPRKANIAGNL